jgi:hypothetical protein
VDVLPTGALVFVAMPAAPPIRIITYTSSPKYCPAAVDIRQLPRMEPVLFGAVIAMEMSICVFAGTLWGSVYVTPLIASPPVKANLKPASHAQVPLFLTFHVFVKVWPGVIDVLSGIVTSLTYAKPLQDVTGVEPIMLVPNGVTFAIVGGENVSEGVLVGVGVFVGAASAVCVRPPEKVATAMV